MNDFWMYSNKHGVTTIVNVIDGKKMLQGESIEYLMKEKNMDQNEALTYINNLRHC